MPRYNAAAEKTLPERLAPICHGAKNPWDQFKVRLFKLRYKTMNGLNLTPQERFVTAICDTDDDSISLDNHAKEFYEWYRTIFLPRWWKLKPKRERKWKKNK